MTDSGSLGQRLAARRRSAGLTQEQLARAADVSVTTIGNIERGTASTPQTATLRRITTALGLAGPAQEELLALAADSSRTKPIPRPRHAREPVGHAFLSYVREDSSRIDQLQQALEAAGIPVWRDTASLWPGQDWRAKIRQAITDDALVFVACFSSASRALRKSYQNEELVLAVEQLRQRPPYDPWLIPVRLDECQIPDLDLGGGRTLASIQRADLFADRYGDEMAKLIAAISQILGNNDITTTSRPRAAISAAPADTATTRQGRRKTGPFKTIVILPLLAAALITAGAYALSQIQGTQSATTVTGSVACESGQRVVGVWIAASTGQADSGLAHLGPPNPTSISSPTGSKGTYSYRLPHGGTYAAHVGCGGTAHHWATSNYSPLLSSPTAHLHCQAPARAATSTSPQGRCLITAAP